MAIPECIETAGFKNSTSLYSRISYFVEGPLSATVIILGLTGNVLSFLIFYSHSLPRPCIYLYLMVLSCWDSTLLISAGFLYCIPTLIYGNEIVASVGSYVPTYPFWLYTSNCTLIGTVWTVLVLTVDRYLALCKPLKHRLLLSRSNIKRLLICMSAVVSLYSLPRFFDLTVIDCWSSESNETLKTFIPSELSQNHAYQTVYRILGAFLFYSVAPCILLFFLTIRISVGMKKAAKHRSTLTSSRRTLTAQASTGSNRMLLTLILKFLCCHSLPTAVDIIETSVSDDQFTSSEIISYTIKLSNFLVIINSGTNFWVYLSSSPSFRNGCRRVLTGKCKPERFSALRSANTVQETFQIQTFLLRVTRSRRSGKRSSSSKSDNYQQKQSKQSSTDADLPLLKTEFIHSEEGLPNTYTHSPSNMLTNNSYKISQQAHTTFSEEIIGDPLPSDTFV